MKPIPSTPKVVVSVFGRFHAFNLARQLHRFGFLQRLITTYPKFVTTKYGLPNSEVVSLWPFELFTRGWAVLPNRMKKRCNAQFFIHELFDRASSACIPDGPDIFVGWSSFCLRGLRKAKRSGAFTVVDEGSSHVLTQKKILREESRRWGIPTCEAHSEIVEKELKEYEQADYIAIPSSFVKRSFLENGVPVRKLLQVPYGVDPDEFKPIPKEDSVFRILHCGSLSLRKGVHYLLQAFSELKLPNSELRLIGGMTPEMQPFLAKYATDRVKLAGPYPQNILYKHYSQASVFCLASVEDGFGMVILQAMSCGLPILASTNTGAEDVIEEGKEGRIIPIRDVQSIKERLVWFYENPQLRVEMGKAARVKVNSCFTWNHYGRSMMEAYFKISGKRVP